MRGEGSATGYQPFPTPALPRLEDAPQLSQIASIIANNIANDGTLSEQQKSMAAAHASLGGAKPKDFLASIKQTLLHHAGHPPLLRRRVLRGQTQPTSAPALAPYLTQ